MLIASYGRVVHALIVYSGFDCLQYLQSSKNRNCSNHKHLNAISNSRKIKEHDLTLFFVGM